MRLVGYCTSCRRVRYVRVTAHDLALLSARHGVARGLCAECEEQERRRRTRGAGTA